MSLTSAFIGQPSGKLQSQRRKPALESSINILQPSGMQLPAELAGDLSAAGLLFSVWTRLHLGNNWSQTVTIKEDHELITSGPYSLVRHPIYSGLLTGFIGSAIALDKWRGIVAVLLVFIVLWHKLRLEEKWMHSQFGEAYESHSIKVAILIPYLL